MSRIGYGVGATGVFAFTVDKLLDHGDFGVLVFGLLSVAAMFFGWLSMRGKPPVPD